MSTPVDTQTEFALMFMGVSNRALVAEARLFGVEGELQRLRADLTRAVEQRDMYRQRLEGRFR